MSDDKSARHSPDSESMSTTQMNFDTGLFLGVTPEKLKELVTRVGTSAEKVREAAKS